MNLNRKGAAFVLFVMFFLSLFSCQNAKNKRISDVEELLGREINIPNRNIERNCKILILVTDTADCATYAMQIYDWYVYKLDLNKQHLDCDVIYVLNDSVELSSQVVSLMDRYQLCCETGLSSFWAENESLKEVSFTTYLLDADNKIRLLGSPIDNIHLWKLYKKVLREMNVHG